MQHRTRACLSGAVALVAASGLGGVAALAQTGATSPAISNPPSQGTVGGGAGSENGASVGAGVTGTATPSTEQNAGAAPAAGAAPSPSTELTVEKVRSFIGKDVLAPNGNVLGTLDNVTTGPNGQPEKVVVSRGGFLGLFQSQYKADWTAAKPQIENGKLVFALTPQELSQQTANK